MAATMRQGTKTITMAPVPEDPAPAPVAQRKQADGGRFRLQVDRQTKARMRPMKLRKKREKQSRKTIRSFRSRCMTA